MIKDQRILITGGAGYIGALLTPMLLEHTGLLWVDPVQLLRANNPYPLINTAMLLALDTLNG